MRTLSLSTSRLASPAPDWRFRCFNAAAAAFIKPSGRFAIHSKLLAVFLPRGRNLAILFPQLSQVVAGCDGRLHVLHRDPFERAMRVVLTAEQVGSGQSQLGKARAIGPATDDVVI